MWEIYFTYFYGCKKNQKRRLVKNEGSYLRKIFFRQSERRINEGQLREYKEAELSEKVLRGLTENALKCKYNGGTLPIG